jgi:hypothetical protein
MEARRFGEAEGGAADAATYVRSVVEGTGKDNVGYRAIERQLRSFAEAAATEGMPVMRPSEGVFQDAGYAARRIGYVNRTTIETAPLFIARDILGSEDYGVGESQADAVVSDPPYGYGEGLSEADIERIYQAFFQKSLRWLKSGGRLVFCALDKVRTGRTAGLLFTEDILQILNRVSRFANVDFSIGHVYPLHPIVGFVSFWKSKYALNRSIVSVRIFKT